MRPSPKLFALVLSKGNSGVPHRYRVIEILLLLHTSVNLNTTKAHTQILQQCEIPVSSSSEVRVSRGTLHPTLS